jgi:hypothetical protein
MREANNDWRQFKIESANQKFRCLFPDWPAPPRIRALSTLRQGGVSNVPFDLLNLADHVGDDEDAVAINRERLMSAADLPSMPRWLRQVHGTNVIDAADVGDSREADASYTDKPGVICAVLTADCLPILLCDRPGQHVCAIHAGWRGLAAGVIESAISAWGISGGNIFAWLGPAIGPDAFEVGDEVRRQFIDSDESSRAAFRSSKDGRWLADIYHLARLRLAGQGVEHIYGGKWCTFSDPGSFYSYRRDGNTGRMASMIWIQVKPDDC